MTAERKFQDPFAFRPYAKLIFSCNALPFSADHTPAYFRRWSIIPFNRTFPDDKKDRALIDKLIDPAELSGFLNKALEGLRSILTRSRFTEPASVRAALEDYRRDLNPVLRFVEERCQLSAGRDVTKESLYEAYQDWCDRQGIEHPLQDCRFAKELRQVVPGLTDSHPRGPGGRKVPTWRGLGISLTDGGAP